MLTSKNLFPKATPLLWLRCRGVTVWLDLDGTAGMPVCKAGRIKSIGKGGAIQSSGIQFEMDYNSYSRCLHALRGLDGKTVCRASQTGSDHGTANEQRARIPLFCPQHAR